MTSEQYILRKATEDDVIALVGWDESAALASTRSGFTEEERNRHAATYREVIARPDFDVLILQVSYEEKGCGAVVIEYQRGKEHIDEVIAGPFRAEEAGTPMSLEEFRKIVDNEVPNLERVHIKSIALDETLRAKGVGKKFLKLVFDRLKEKNIDALTFSTGKENIAMQRLMKEADFLEVRSSKGGYADTKLIGLVRLH